MKALGFGVLSFIFLTVLLNSVAILFHGTVSPVWTVVSLILSLAITYLLAKRAGDRRPYVWVAALVVLVVGSIAISAITIDTTYDGNTYHKQAIGELKNGWNPLYGATSDIYANTYPKASWIFAAGVYQLVGTIEAGKAINFLVISLVFLSAFIYFRARLSVAKSALLAALLAIGPVTVVQLFSNYVDGLLGGLLIALIIMLNTLVDKKQKVNRRYIYLAIIMLITIIGNLKFTGLVYAGVVALVYWLFIVFRKDWVNFRRLTVSGVIALVLAIGIVGAPTYIKNTIHHGHPLYPLMGEGAVDIMAANQPPTYADKNRIIKFFESNFGRTDNTAVAWAGDQASSAPRFKIPFTFSDAEIKIMSDGAPDIRRAGYGVWFGGILLLSAAAFVYLTVKYRHRIKKSEVYLAILPMVPIAVTALLLEESWWARYLPHLVVVPVVVLALLLINKVKILPYLLTFAMIYNIIIVAVLTIRHQATVVGDIRHSIQTHITCENEDRPQEIVVTKKVSFFKGSMYNLLDRCQSLTVRYQADYTKLDEHYVEVWNGIYTSSSSRLP